MKLKILFCMVLVSAISFNGNAGKLKMKDVKKKLSSAISGKTKDVKKYDFEYNGTIPLDKAVMPILPKNSTLVHQVTMGVFGPADGKKGANINVIYRTSGKDPEIMVLTPVEPGKYMKNMPVVLNFGKKEKVEILSVFFDQADKDTPRELFVLCSVPGEESASYKTAVFDWTPKGFARMPRIESKVKELMPSLRVRRILPDIVGK